MRRDFWFGVLTALGLLALLGASEPYPTVVGRYQLFQGTYNNFVIKEKRVESINQITGMFLLDTATGELKQYISSNVSTGWGPPAKDLPSAQSVLSGTP